MSRSVKQVKNRLRPTGKRNAQVNPTATSAGRDGGGPDNYNGRARTRAGSVGKEPGGRFTPAYYETKGKVIQVLGDD